jgi:hypothetical protein
MSKLTEEKKQEIRKKYNLKPKICEQCGASGALWRFYVNKTLCNACARPAFLKFLAAISAIIIAFWVFG